MILDQHRMTATIFGLEFAVVEASTTLDRGWSPYAQGSLTVVTEDDVDLLGMLHPGTRYPVTVRYSRRYSDSWTVREVSESYAGRTVAQVGAANNGETVETMSARYRTVWNGPGGRYGADAPLILNGWLTRIRRQRDNANRFDVEWCGDEIRALSRYSARAAVEPEQDTVRGIVSATLAPLAGLAPGTANAPVERDEDNRLPRWEPGTTMWDYLEPIVTAAGLRLYADETGVWRLTADLTPTSPAVELGAQAVNVTDLYETDNDRFFDHAVIVYEWETAAGQPRRQVDAYAEGETSGYTETIQGRMSRPGRAEAIVSRAMARAFAQEWACVADYSVRPGMLAATTPDAGIGLIDSVTWTYPDARMSVNLIDVQTP